MAKIDDTAAKLNWFGSKFNDKQMKLAIPGGPQANEGGKVFIEAIDSSGNPNGGIFAHTDGSVLRISTSDPSDTNLDGYALDNTTIGAACNKALSNLASVAVNTNIVSDTDSTDNLGSSSIFWANAYIDKLYLYSSTHAIDGSGGTTVLTGGVAFGVSGTGIDVQFYGTTAGKDMLWDESRDALTLTDNCKIEIGASQDLVIYHDGTSNDIDSGTANMAINFGSNTATDVIFHGAADNIHFDASADLLRFEDTFIVGFGTGGSTDYDIGLAYAAANTLSWTQKVAGTGSILKGVDGKGIDETWYAETASDYMKWDQDGASNLGALIFEDSVIQFAGANSTYNLAISTDAFAITGTDHANTQVTFGTTGTTNSMDVVFNTITAGDFVTFDAGSKTWTWTDVIPILTDGDPFYFGSDSSGDVAIDFDGTANTLDVTLKKGTTTGMSIIPYASATVAALEIDGDANGWKGADNVGMLHLRNDVAAVNAGATLLMVDDSSTPITAAEGFLARFVHSGTARTNSHAVEIEVPASQPALKTNGIVNVTGQDGTGAALVQIAGIDTTGNNDTVLIDHSGDGYAINIDLNEATSDGIKVEAFTNHTVPLILLDGDTAGFLGASNIGMLTIQNDIALTNVNSSALVIDVGATKPIDAAEGYCFRIIDTSLVATTPPAYAAYIDTTANEGMGIETRAAAAKNLVLLGVAGQTDSMLHVDGTTGAGWDGADGVGMVELAGDGAHAHANASLLNIIDGTGASIASGRGTSLRIVDTTTVGADSWVAYIDTTANDGLLINTGHADGINLKLTGLQAQVGQMLHVDGTTGTGWDGADDTGMVHIASDAALVHTGATLLYVTNTGVIDDAEGNIARFLDTSGAGSGTAEYAVEISSTNNEALHVSSGDVRLADSVKLEAGTAGEWGIYNDGTNSISVLGTDDWRVGSAATNYTQFAVTSGKLSFAGTAKPTQNIWLGPSEFEVFAGSVALGIPTGCQFKAWAFDAASDETLSTAFYVPEDWDDGAVNAYIYYNTSATSGAVVWDVITSPFTEGEDMAVAGTNTDSVTDTVDATAYYLNVTTAIAIAANTEWAAGDLIVMNINRDANNTADTAAADVNLIGVKITYTANQV